MRLYLKNGAVHCLHSDDNPIVEQFATVATSRASHVEPGKGGWYADMSPVYPLFSRLLPRCVLALFGLPVPVVLGPFPKRQEALAAETEWLHQNNHYWAK